VWLLSEAVEGEVELLVEFFEVMSHQVAHLDVLEVVPAPFVPGVQVSLFYTFQSWSWLIECDCGYCVESRSHGGCGTEGFLSKE
jgi:hypothetical protein